MTTLTIFIIIAFGISLVLILTKSHFQKAEKIVKRISLYSSIGTLICILLLIFDLRIKGAYTNTFIGLTFLISTIILFGLAKNNGTKMLTGLFAVPIGISAIFSFFWSIALLPIYLIGLPFAPPMGKFKMNENHNVEVRVGGFMACGESLVITKSIFGILDKQKYVGNNSCVTGINKIETKEFNENIADFLIYHDGTRTEFENPYEYQAEIKNVW